MKCAPTNVEEAARFLKDCTKAGRHVYITGNTGEEALKAGQANEHSILSTSSMRGIITYAPEDMYITVGAGTSLAEVQTFLGEHGQQIPWRARGLALRLADW